MLKTLRQMWRLAQALYTLLIDSEAVLESTHQKLTENRAELAQYDEDLTNFIQKFEEFQQRWDGAGGLTATETDDVFNDFTQIKNDLASIGKETTHGD